MLKLTAPWQIGFSTAGGDSLLSKRSCIFVRNGVGTGFVVELTQPVLRRNDV
jgi:hypothetical protein